MPFTIHWVDYCSGAETIEILHLPVGTLLVTRQSDVITDIAWARPPLQPIHHLKLLCLQKRSLSTLG